MSRASRASRSASCSSGSRRLGPLVGLHEGELVDGDGRHRPLVESQGALEHLHLEPLEQLRQPARVADVAVSVASVVMTPSGRVEQAAQVLQGHADVVGDLGERAGPHVVQPVAHGDEELRDRVVVGVLAHTSLRGISSYQLSEKIRRPSS